MGAFFGSLPSRVKSDAERKLELDRSRIRERKITAENKQKGGQGDRLFRVIWLEPTSVFQKLMKQALGNMSIALMKCWKPVEI